VAKIPELPPLGKSVHKYRQQAGWSLDELARRSDVSQAILAQVEAGEVNPTVAAVWKIAHGLGVSVQELLGGQKEEGRIEVLRRDQYPLLTDVKGCVLRVISPIQLAGELELYLLELEAGTILDSKPHFAGAEEFTTVLEGTLEVRVGEQVQKVDAGDSIHYPADVPHCLTNTGRDRAKLYMVVRYVEREKGT